MTTAIQTTPLFPLGEIVTTPGALALAGRGVNLAELISRHQSGDWSELSEDDRLENEFSVASYLRIVSGYDTKCGRVWVITEADRSLTTLLLPDEY